MARFVRRAIRSQPRLDLKLVSLSMSSTDPCSRLLRKPFSWLKPIGVKEGRFDGEPFVHVGAAWGEVELQRLRPRPVLARILEDCDLIQVVAGIPSWALPVVGLGRPVVLQVATLARIERRRRLEKERGPLALWRGLMTSIVERMDAHALRSVDAILVENDWMYDHVKAVVGDGPALVVRAPPGVDTSLFRPADNRQPGPGYVLSVGRFNDARKNVGLLLEAYGRLCARMPDVAPRLVLAGLMPAPEAFWRRAEALRLSDRIQYLHRPSTEELSQLYRSASVFALTSDEEGFGMVIIEAMASGVPVVSTRSGGPDAIISDGRDGFLVDRDDAEGIADRLHRLTTNPALNIEMGRQGRATVEARYSEEVAAKAYLDVYQKVWGRGPGGNNGV